MTSRSCPKGSVPWGATHPQRHVPLDLSADRGLWNFPPGLRLRPPAVARERGQPAASDLCGRERAGECCLASFILLFIIVYYSNFIFK